jgi:N utilization substance protein A
MALPGVGTSLADALYEKGFYSAEEIAKASREEILQIRGVDDAAADSLIAAAQAAVERAATAELETEQSDTATPNEEPGRTDEETDGHPAADPAASSAEPADGPVEEA